MMIEYSGVGRNYEQLVHEIIHSQVSDEYVQVNIHHLFTILRLEGDPQVEQDWGIPGAADTVSEDKVA